MQLEEITPLILTYNEAANLDRTLQQLTWAKQIIVIDSYSTDETLDIIQFYSQVQLFKRKFDSFANQCNFGLTKIVTPWVLSLDADYVLSDALIQELKCLSCEEIDSYTAELTYCVAGRPLRGTLLPPRTVLYRLEKACYRDDGHAHRVQVLGTEGSLRSVIYHDDRKPLTRWLWAQDRYMVIEAKKLLETPNSQLSRADRIRKQKIFAPWLVLFYCLILKGGILDGWHGWYYALQRVLAEILLAIRLIEVEKLSNSNRLNRK